MSVAVATYLIFSDDFSKSKKLSQRYNNYMKQERLNKLMIHKEHTDKLDLKQVANDFVSGDQHRCAFLDHLLLATKWVGVVGWVWLWPYHFKGACSGPGRCTESQIMEPDMHCTQYRVYIYSAAWPVWLWEMLVKNTKALVIGTWNQT